ncbi:unnamed protein product, partial [marine sediment metagenome]
MTGKGLRPSELIRTAITAGGSYRKQDMLSDIRMFEDRLRHETQIMQTPFNQKVPISYMTETGLNQDVKYRVHGYVTMYDEETDTYLRKKASFYTNDYAETGDYSESFIKAYWQKYQEEALEVSEFEVRAVEHNTLL